MADVAFDFAVVGAGPLALLVAGCLAEAHGRRVVVVGDLPSPFRVPRQEHVSVAPFTRPETWSLLGHCLPETIKLLRAMGAGTFEHQDALFVARSGPAIDALAHIRHMAAGFGHAAERESRHGVAACRIRDAAVLRPVELAIAAAAWLARLDVPVLPGAGTSVRLMRRGGMRIETARRAFDAAHGVLADDDAVLALGGDITGLAAAEATSILTEPVAPLPGSLIFDMDDRVLLRQAPGGQVVARAPGGRDVALPRIARAMAARGGIRRAGEVTHAVVVSADGAPVIASTRPPRATVFAGLGPVGAFLAPAIARFLAGASTAVETEWFAARAARRARSGVADVEPALPAEASA